MTVPEAILVAQMRQQTTVEAALQLGALLSAELKLYTAAAVAFHQQDFSSAERLFASVISTYQPQSSNKDAAGALLYTGPSAAKTNTGTESEVLGAVSTITTRGCQPA